MFHKHNWKVLSEKVLPSLAEVGINNCKIGMAPSGPGWFVQKHVVIVSCTECGKLKHIVTETAF